MERDFKGIWIPKNIWIDKEINIIQKLLLVEIDSLDNENGCFASNAYFSEFFGISETQISKNISALKECGYIKEVSFDGRKRILKSCIEVLLRSDINKTASLPGRKVKGSHEENFIHNNIDNNTDIVTSSKEEVTHVQEDENAVNDKVLTTKKSLSLTAKEELFEKFWNICKIHSRKADAKKKFLKLTIKECELCITAMDIYNKMKEAKKDPSKFYKVPANWIEERMFEDEIIVDEITEDEKYDYRRSDSSKEKNDIVAKYNPEFATLRAKGKQDARTPEENARCVEIIKEFEAKYSLEHVFDFGI